MLAIVPRVERDANVYVPGATSNIEKRPAVLVTLPTTPLGVDTVIVASTGRPAVSITDPCTTSTRPVPSARTAVAVGTVVVTLVAVAVAVGVGVGVGVGDVVDVRVAVRIAVDVVDVVTGVRTPVRIAGLPTKAVAVAARIVSAIVSAPLAGTVTLRAAGADSRTGATVTV